MAGDLANLDGPLLSLLPRTLGVYSEAMAAVVAAESEPQELDSLHALFKSMASSSSIIEQAKAIFNGTSGPSLLYSEDGDEAVDANVKDNPRGRRPALGRKRARFSFKPSTSRSLVDIDLKSSLDHLEDPEEFFATFERMENADKELKRLRGDVSTDSSQHIQVTTTRQRRPGILRKKAHYKHYFPTHAASAETLVVSQEKLQTVSQSKNASLCNIFSPPNDLPDTSRKLETDAAGLFDSSNQEGLLNGNEKSVDRMLDTLFSSFKGVKEGEETAFMQKYLQIEPLHVDKLHFPLPDKLQINDARVMNDIVTRQKVVGSKIIQASPSPTSSAFATISVLKRHISQIDPLKDPYLMSPTDYKSSPELSLSDEGRERKALSPSIDIDQPNTIHLNTKDASTPVKLGSRLSFEGNLQSPITKEDNTINNLINLAELPTKDSSCPPDRNTDLNSSIFERERVVRSVRLDGCSEEKVDAMLLEASILKQPGAGPEDLPYKTLNCNGTEGSSAQFDNSVPTDGSLDNGITVDSFEFGGTLDDKVSGVLQEGPAFQDKEQPSLVAETTLLVDEHFENSNISPEQNNEENQTFSGVSVHRQVRQKTIPQTQNKQKSNNRRSLADAGIMWEAGVRRSKRIRIRPLEYWRGERVLYGRIHDSLATVIGLKYASPDKSGGKPVLKVKSYVSEEYAELLEKVALH